jgi:hypothetical protein
MNRAASAGIRLPVAGEDVNPATFAAGKNRTINTPPFAEGVKGD